jgi:hypothetical protein
LTLSFPLATLVSYRFHKKKSRKEGVKMSELSPEAVEARREYSRDWSRKNREKRKESNARYWERYAARKKAEREDELMKSDKGGDLE